MSVDKYLMKNHMVVSIKDQNSKNVHIFVTPNPLVRQIKGARTTCTFLLFQSFSLYKINFQPYNDLHA